MAIIRFAIDGAQKLSREELISVVCEEKWIDVDPKTARLSVQTP
jgi:hypothetical protein